MKKLLMSTVLALGAITVAASGAQAKFVFALVPKNMNNPFFDQARDGCKKAEAESNGEFECMYIGPGEHGGGDEAVAIVQDLVAKKVDGIAVSPANAAAMAVAAQAAKDAGIPVLTWDSDLLPENSRAAPRRPTTMSACRASVTNSPASSPLPRPAIR
jgi:ribose transport system substrate-binding protein